VSVDSGILFVGIPEGLSHPDAIIDLMGGIQTEVLPGIMGYIRNNDPRLVQIPKGSVKGRFFVPATYGEFMVFPFGAVVEDMFLPIRAPAIGGGILEENPPATGHGSLIPQGGVLGGIEQVQFPGRA